MREFWENHIRSGERLTSLSAYDSAKARVNAAWSITRRHKIQVVKWVQIGWGDLQYIIQGNMAPTFSGTEGLLSGLLHEERCAPRLADACRRPKPRQYATIIKVRLLRAANRIFSIVDQSVIHWLTQTVIHGLILPLTVSPLSLWGPLECKFGRVWGS